MESDSRDDLHHTGSGVDTPPGFGEPSLGGPLQPLPSPWLLGLLETYQLWKLLRQRLARMCRLVLPADEGRTIRYVMYGQRHIQGLPLLFFFRPPGPRMIVVTQNYVYVIRVGVGWINAGSVVGLPFLTPPKQVIAQLPRETCIGPVSPAGRSWISGDWRRWGKTTIGGEEIFIAPRYLRDVEAVDSEV